MIKSISRKMKYLLVAVFALVFSFSALIVSMPKAYAGEKPYDKGTKYPYNTQSGDFLEGSTQTKDGRLKWNIPVLENKQSNGGNTGYCAAFYLKADETLVFEFNTSGRIIRNLWMSYSYLYKAKDLIDSETGKTDPNTPYPSSSVDYKATGQTTIKCNGYSFTYPENSTLGNDFEGDFWENGPHTTDSLFIQIVNKSGEDTIFVLSNSGYLDNMQANMLAYWYEAAPAITVDFDQQGGTGGTSSISADIGSAMPSITLPTKTGYTFDGYYTGTNGSGTKYYNANGTSAANCPDNNLKLYAKWTVNSYTVTLNNNGGTGGSTSVSATYDSAMPSATMPTRTGYNFIGYYDTSASSGGTQYYSSTGTSARTWNKTSNTTLYARWQLKAEIQDVIDKINDIGTVSYPTSKEKIDIARTAYNDLSESFQSLVSNYDTLTTAEGTYNTLRTNAINDLIAAIDAIGEVTYPNSKDAIVSCENAYAALDTNDRSEITNYETLTNARTEYDRQGEGKVNEVIDAINSIDEEITYPGSEAGLTNANNLYNSLDDVEKASVTNYSDLVTANSDYNTLKESAVNNVIALINAIIETKPLVYPDAKTKINTARTAFDALGNNDKNATVVTNLQILLNAEIVTDLVNYINNIGTVEDTDTFREKVTTARTNYNALTSDQNELFPTSILGKLVDLETIVSVMDTINAIGNVEYTNTSKDLIDAAQAAYEALDDDLKDDVANYGKLVQANIDYDKVDESVVKINNIPEFEYTSEFKDIIDDARNTYDALTDYQKSILPQDVLDKLLDAEKKYDAIDKITNIGKIENTKESRNRVKKAKEAYDALDEDQKQIVSDEALKNLNDAVAVVDVIEEVNSVKNAGYTTKDKEKIDATRTSYNALTDDQKELFPANTLEMLTNIETTYPVMVSINQLGNVQYTSEFKNKLDTIKEIYDSLTKEQKDLVRNYVVLSVDMQSYNRVDDAYKAIEAIDKVKYNSSSKEAIDDARKCYNKLNDDEKELIPDEEEKLIKAEKKYEKAEHSHNVGMTWLKVICIIFGIAILLLGIFFLIILLKRRKKEEEDEEEKNNKKSRK